MSLGSGLLPVGWFGREAPMPVWGWIVFGVTLVVAVLLGAAYSKGGPKRKVSVLLTAVLAALIVAFFGALSGAHLWASSAGLARLQPLVGLVGSLALVLAGVLASKKRRTDRNPRPQK